jgi:CRISPR-associated protein Cmr1
MVLDGNNFSLIQRQIKAGQTFVLRFIPLRPVWDEEWCLLNATLRFIAGYEASWRETPQGSWAGEYCGRSPATLL